MGRKDSVFDSRMIFTILLRRDASRTFTMCVNISFSSLVFALVRSLFLRGVIATRGQAAEERGRERRDRWERQASSIGARFDRPAVDARETRSARARPMGSAGVLER